MKPAKLLIVALMVMLVIPSAYASDIQKEFSGIKWGEKPANVSRLIQQSRREDVAYYTRQNDNIILGNMILGHGVYGFYQDRFFAVFVNLKNQADVDRMVKRLNFYYGEPWEKMKVNSSILIWKKDDIKIKLKQYYDRDKYKLGYYYLPLSAKLNTSRLENEFEKVVPPPVE
jgi:hypothetical protein